jgi:hypothetical protein
MCKSCLVGSGPGVDLLKPFRTKFRYLEHLIWLNYKLDGFKIAIYVVVFLGGN